MPRHLPHFQLYNAHLFIRTLLHAHGGVEHILRVTFYFVHSRTALSQTVKCPRSSANHLGSRFHCVRQLHVAATQNLIGHFHVARSREFILHFLSRNGTFPDYILVDFMIMLDPSRKITGFPLCTICGDYPNRFNLKDYISCANTIRFG